MADRIDNWQQALASYISETAREPFAYGAMDCATFAADAVEAMTGEVIAPGLRGYSTRDHGLRGAREAGFKDHVAVFADALPEVRIADALPGDVAAVVVDRQRHLALGIIQGTMVYVRMPHGLGLVPLASAQRAFKVGA